MAGVAAKLPDPQSQDMSLRSSTVADLRRAGTVSSSEIVAAVDRYMRDPAMRPYRFASGHSVDIVAAVAATPEISTIRANPGPQGKTLRHVVTTATMAAQAVPPAIG